MQYQCIIYEKKDKIGLIRLNRPKVLNAMNLQLWMEVLDVLEKAKQDDTVKALIITGAGRAFSTGADLKDRITSYNVCYTKLLRSTFTKDMDNSSGALRS